ncbi:MAG: hypothetical protein B6U69_01935 [Thermofilum sp. ex4484_15]|nr:MAG: hypothetical protein B6U69_01935 [Thermofilum sp. ex4484_15]
MKEIRKAIELVKGFDSALLIHHDDADGITSAAIMVRTLEELGLSVKPICLEKLFEETLSLISSQPYDLFIYVDIGSPHSPLIADKLAGRYALILDHHNPKEIKCANLINLNPELFGFSGERDASGATMAFLFSKEALGSAYGELAALAVIGSAEIPGKLGGLNAIALKEGIKAGKVKAVEGRRGIEYLVNLEGAWKSYKTISRDLTALASVGYYRGGPLKALKALTEGGYHTLSREISYLEELRRKKLREVIKLISKGGLRELKFVQWFHVGDLLKGLGSKTIGTIASYLSYRPSLIKSNKYLLAAMNYERIIPGLGEIKGKYSKFSARAPLTLRERIGSGDAPPIASLLEPIARAFNGFFDGHDFAASGLIPRGSEGNFVEAVDLELSRSL